MCLLTNDPTPKVAEQHITCYKVLIVTENGLRTPFQLMSVEVPSRICCQDNGSRLTRDCKGYMVEGQGVHAFVRRSHATYLAEHGIVSKGVVAECRIPAGTEYWLGEKFDIAARVLHIEKIL